MGCRGSCVRITSPRPIFFGRAAHWPLDFHSASAIVAKRRADERIRAGSSPPASASRRTRTNKRLTSRFPGDPRVKRGGVFMSVAHHRHTEKTGVVAELALARAQRNTVVIIDDLFSSRLLLAEIVRQIDGKLNLELFDTPSRALEYARGNRVDMILTDYKLPEFDGIQLVRQLRALPHCIDVPIVVITVVDDRRVRYEALEAGATDFLIKPLDEHETRARC